MPTAVQGTDMAMALALAVPQETPPPAFGRAMRTLFQFDADWTNLNHGSFGATPAALSRVYQHFQALSERRPDTYMRSIYPALLLESRRALGALLNVSAQDLVFVPNTTTGINTVLRGLQYAPSDAVLYFDFIYGACGNTVEYIAESTAASAVRVPISLPISDDALVGAFRVAVAAAAAAGKVVRVAVFDIIVSMPSVRLPYKRLVAACKELGVLSLIDAAHGVGHIPLDLGALDADFVTSNCYKWLFVPRGCALLHVARRNQELIRSTLPTSWGFVPQGAAPGVVSPLPAVPGDSRWAQQFTFVGTSDGSSYLSVPAAIAFREWLGGETKIIAYLHDVAQRGAEVFRRRLGTEVMDSFGEGGLGMYNIRLPLASEEVGGRDAEVVGWIQGAMDAEGTFVAVFEYKGSWWCRVSGQIYLEETDYERGADVVSRLVEQVRSGEW